MSSDAEKFWDDVVGELRSAHGFSIPTPGEAWTELSSTGLDTLSDDEIKTIVVTVVSGKRTTGTEETRRVWHLRPQLAVAVAVVAVLFAIAIVSRWGSPLSESGVWGWNRPRAFAANIPPDRYLDLLADEAAEWFNERPQEPQALAQRIAEFRQGCTALIHAEHRQLSAKDRAWLIENCQAWAEQLKAHLVAIEVARDATEVRVEVDDTIDDLIKALRLRGRRIVAGSS